MSDRKHNSSDQRSGERTRTIAVQNRRNQALASRNHRSRDSRARFDGSSSNRPPSISDSSPRAFRGGFRSRMMAESPSHQLRNQHNNSPRARNGTQADQIVGGPSFPLVDNRQRISEYGNRVWNAWTLMRCSSMPQQVNLAVEKTRIGQAAVEPSVLRSFNRISNAESTTSSLRSSYNTTPSRRRWETMYKESDQSNETYHVAEESDPRSQTSSHGRHEHQDSTVTYVAAGTAAVEVTRNARSGSCTRKASNGSCSRNTSSGSCTRKASSCPSPCDQSLGHEYQRALNFSLCGEYKVSRMDVLSEQIWHQHHAMGLTRSSLTKKLLLRDLIWLACCKCFPLCGLYIVGSSLNGFGNESSDLDIDQRTDALLVLGAVEKVLGQLDVVTRLDLIRAKVPILRITFKEPYAGVVVDLNANNSVTIRNTHLLYYYSISDWRVRPLVAIVKEWARRRQMNDGLRSSFTSYSLVLMVIHYLQCGANPPVLPSLQVVYPKKFHAKSDVRQLTRATVADLAAGTARAQRILDAFRSERNTMTLGELLIGFLDYFARFDYDNDAISIRNGSKTTRSAVARFDLYHQNPLSLAQWRCVCIEEPFTLSNAAHSVHDEMVFAQIKTAFKEGLYELDVNRDLNAFLNQAPIAGPLQSFHASSTTSISSNCRTAMQIRSPHKTSTMEEQTVESTIDTASITQEMEIFMYKSDSGENLANLSNEQIDCEVEEEIGNADA